MYIHSGCIGIVDPMLRDLAACGGRSGNDPHACRNLHRLIHKTARQLRVTISRFPTPIRTSKRGKPLRWRMEQFPIILPSSWLSAVLSAGGNFFLGAQNLDQAAMFAETLYTFWDRWHKVDGTITLDEQDWRTSIPVALHGDEGRGKGKKPIMVLSLQPLVTSPDMSTSNMAGHLHRSKKHVISVRKIGVD